MSLRNNNLKSKKIIIVGMGREGLDNFLFCRQLFPDRILGLADKLNFENLPQRTKKIIKNDKKNKSYFGDDYLKKLKKYDIIIKSAGIPPKVILPFITKQQRIINQTEIFFDNCPGRIIGITATKGKSTTTSLIYTILKESRFKAHLIGNIGKPVLKFLANAGKNDIYVYELSSHQLENLKKSPHIAVFLNIYPEHLDYHQNFKQYALAKSNIAINQTRNDYLIFNAKNKIVKAIAKKSLAKKIAISPEWISKIISLDEIPLKGKFYLLNVAAAIEVAKIFHIPDWKIKAAIKKFKPLPHRLEFIKTFQGIDFYNDSLATTPPATIAAINSFGNKLQTIILGGFDRGGIDYKELAKTILNNKIKTLILFPTTGEKIWQEILKQTKKIKFLPKHFFVDNMKDAISLCYQKTSKGKICLLSPASPSFGLFKDYKDRGKKFKEIVKRLK